MRLPLPVLDGCATYYHIFSGAKSTYFTEQEKALLDKTTKSIDFDYGFDQDMELDYVFPMTQGYTIFKDGDKELSRALEALTTGRLSATSKRSTG